MDSAQPTEGKETSPTSSMVSASKAGLAPKSVGNTVSPQACPTCGTAPAANSATAMPPVWIYAIGRIEARFPRISVEKEFAQALGRDHTAGLTDRQALHGLLSKPENRYLVRQLC